MKIVQHNLDYSIMPPGGVLLFTGNNYVKRNGELVMGRGAAKEVRDLYPLAAPYLGHEITKFIDKDGFYGLAFTGWEDITLGVLQVKKHYSSNADLDLIAHSINDLDKLARRCHYVQFHCNFPGIGNGHLKFSDVFPLLSDLPDNVTFYRSN